MLIVTDQTGRKVELKREPKRIVSVVPSQTELLCDLGLEKELVGITKFCVHPPHLRDSKEIVGGTKKLRLAKISDLQPDLIIANKEENTRRDIEELMKSFPVYVSDIASPDDCLEFTNSIGEITGKTAEAEMLMERLKFSYSEIKNLSAGRSPKKVLYLIWKDPYMAAGTDTYISEMLNLCGLENVLESWGDQGLRYPAITEREIIGLNPELILFSSEPYPFTENHIIKLASETGIPGKYVDGEIFSWYGSRILHCLNEITEFIQEIE